MPMRALAALVLLLGLTAAAASALAAGAPGCCAGAGGAAPCNEVAFDESPSPCCELLPAEAAPGSQDARDAVRPLAALPGSARQIAPLRTPPAFPQRPALPRQAAPDSTTVLRI